MTADELIIDLRDRAPRTLPELFKWLREHMADIRKLPQADDDRVHAAYAVARDAMQKI